MGTVLWTLLTHYRAVSRALLCRRRNAAEGEGDGGWEAALTCGVIRGVWMSPSYATTATSMGQKSVPASAVLRKPAGQPRTPTGNRLRAGYSAWHVHGPSGRNAISREARNFFSYPLIDVAV